MIKNMDMEDMYGLMDVYIKDILKMILSNTYIIY